MGSTAPAVQVAGRLPAPAAREATRGGARSYTSRALPAPARAPGRTDGLPAGRIHAPVESRGLQIVRAEPVPGRLEALPPAASPDEGEGKPKNLLAAWNARSASLQEEVINFGMAGACTLVVCNAAYFAAAYLVTWIWILHVPTGVPPGMVGVYVAEAMGIAYSSCQVTKLPRIMGTLLLVPAARALLDKCTGGHKPAGRRIFMVLLVTCVSAVLAMIGGLALLSMC